MSQITKRYLERMNIADAMRLAVALEIPITELLDVSLRLCEDVPKRNLKSVRDLPELSYADITLTA